MTGQTFQAWDPPRKDWGRLVDHIELFLMRLDSPRANRVIARSTDSFMKQGACARLAFITAFTMEIAENNLCH